MNMHPLKSAKSSELKEKEDRTGCVAKVWKYILIFLAGLAVLVAILAIVGVLYQRNATSRELRRFPPPGKMIEVEGHRIHIFSQGEGVPTVIFDSVLGESSLGWALVQPEIARLTGTCTFDRPGYGWSDPIPRARSSGRIVSELHSLLEQCKVPKPYVLVGASFGGLNVRLFALRYLEEVAGLILVDPVHEDQFARMISAERPSIRSLRLFQLASRLGIMRLANMPIGIAGMNVLPPDLQAQATAIGFRTDGIDAIAAETADIELSFFEVREEKAALGKTPLMDTPLIVLTHQESTPPVGDMAKNYEIWVDLHRELAAESTRGQQIIIENSGHFIAIDQPERVINAIQMMVESVREKIP